MNKQRNHILTMEYSHARRKHRTNVTTRASSLDYRAIANKSNVHNSLTIVDVQGNTVIQKFDKELKGKKRDNAFELWKIVAQLLLDKKITSVVFDRNGFRYTGRIKALADGMRDGWVKI